MSLNKVPGQARSGVANDDEFLQDGTLDQFILHERRLVGAAGNRWMASRASMMSCRYRHSGRFIEHLFFLQDLRPNAGFQARALHQVNRTPEEFCQFALRTAERQKADGRAGLKLHQDVNVTFRPEIPTPGRAKEREPSDAMPAAKPFNGLGRYIGKMQHRLIHFALSSWFKSRWQRTNPQCGRTECAPTRETPLM